MTPTQKQALEAALSALESERIMAADAQGDYTVEVTPKRIRDAIEKVKAALAEPVRYVSNLHGKLFALASVVSVEETLTWSLDSISEYLIRHVYLLGVDQPVRILHRYRTTTEEQALRQRLSQEYTKFVSDWESYHSKEMGS